MGRKHDFDPYGTHGKYLETFFWLDYAKRLTMDRTTPQPPMIKKQPSPKCRTTWA